MKTQTKVESAPTLTTKKDVGISTSINNDICKVTPFYLYLGVERQEYAGFNPVEYPVYYRKKASIIESKKDLLSVVLNPNIPILLNDQTPKNDVNGRIIPICLNGDGYRNDDNFINSNCIVLDIDNDDTDDENKWITPDDVHKLMPDVEFYAVPSSNNMKVKGGRKPRPKYHYYYPIKQINDGQEYKDLLDKIGFLFDCFDTNAQKISQMYKKTNCDLDDIKYYGGHLTIDFFIDDQLKNKPEILDQINNKASKKIKKDKEPLTPGGKIPIGKRNGFICSIVHNYGIEPSDYLVFKMDADKLCDPQLPEDEIKKIWEWHVETYDITIKIKKNKTITNEILDFIFEYKNIDIKLNAISKKLDKFNMLDFTGEINPDISSISTHIRDVFLNDWGIKIDPDIIGKYVLSHAKRKIYSPVIDTLKSIKWDGISRIKETFDTLMPNLSDEEKNYFSSTFNNEDLNTFYLTMFTKWLLQCVAVAHNWNKLFYSYNENAENELLEKETKIENMIYEIRGVQVMLDSDLAKLYECTNGTKDINKAVKRNINRFPEDFYFQLTNVETKKLWFQNGTANNMVRTNPHVFTEQGVAMLSSVLKTNIAADMSIKIIRAFVYMRKYISSDSKNNILILDEATSALDNQTQDNVLKSVYDLKATVIMVAHRLSTVVNCDRILVFKDGNVVEDGNYSQLMEINGIFADLMRKQQLKENAGSTEE